MDCTSAAAGSKRISYHSLLPSVNINGSNQRQWCFKNNYVVWKGIALFPSPVWLEVSDGYKSLRSVALSPPVRNLVLLCLKHRYFSVNYIYNELEFYFSRLLREYFSL